MLKRNKNAIYKLKGYLYLRVHEGYLYVYHVTGGKVFVYTVKDSDTGAYVVLDKKVDILGKSSDTLEKWVDFYEGHRDYRGVITEKLKKKHKIDVGKLEIT